MVHVLTVSSITFQLKNNMIVREITLQKRREKREYMLMESRLNQVYSLIS